MKRFCKQKSVESNAIRDATLIALNRARAAAEALDMALGSIVYVEVDVVLIRESGIIGLESFAKRDNSKILCIAQVKVRFSLITELDSSVILAQCARLRSMCPCCSP